jgi:hypothetical protein
MTTREQKIRKIRILELVSIGLSLTSAGILFAFLNGWTDRGLLNLAMICGVIVAVYQVITIYLTYKVTNASSAHRLSEEKPSETIPAPVEFPAIASRQLNVPASVTDNTTELLDPVAVQRRSEES